MTSTSSHGVHRGDRGDRVVAVGVSKDHCRMLSRRTEECLCEKCGPTTLRPGPDEDGGEVQRCPVRAMASLPPSGSGGVLMGPADGGVRRHGPVDVIGVACR